MFTRVLVVDNILVDLTFLEAKFSLEHYEFLTAGSGVEALEMIQNGPPDIVLLDVIDAGVQRPIGTGGWPENRCP